MNHQESKDLMAAAENWEVTKAGWLADLQIFGIACLWILAVIGATIVMAAVLGPWIAAFALIAAVIVWHNRK